MRPCRFRFLRILGRGMLGRGLIRGHVGLDFRFLGFERACKGSEKRPYSFNFCEI